MTMRARCEGVEGVWWSPRSSKPLRPDRVGLGGFDSHTLPPARRAGAAWRVALAILLVLAAPAAAHAQRDSVATRPTLTSAFDTLAFVEDSTLRPPISPRRAFFSSFILPGAGQAKLDRPYAGGVFLAIEAIALAMRHRSAEDLRLARSFRGDSMPATYQIDPVTGVAARDADGNLIVTGWDVPRYGPGWVRTRRLHLEDWSAMLVFNHLFAGADAFVAAYLWDLPAKVAVQQTPFGPLISASFSFGGPKRPAQSAPRPR